MYRRVNRTAVSDLMVFYYYYYSFVIIIAHQQLTSCTRVIYLYYVILSLLSYSEHLVKQLLVDIVQLLTHVSDNRSAEMII